MSNIQYYITVQDIDRQHTGNKTYIDTIKHRSNYRLFDMQSAVRHFNKIAANKIILNKVTTFDDMPYAKTEFCFGEHDKINNKLIFKDFDAEYSVKDKEWIKEPVRDIEENLEKDIDEDIER